LYLTTEAQIIVIGGRKISLGVNYETLADNGLKLSAGTNPNNSIAIIFLDYANGIPLNVWKNSNYENLDNGHNKAYLGYQIHEN
jgi:hypothetical protein